jgi:hypothetical protein
MDQKVSKESFKAYRDWQRYILKSKPKLSAKIRRVTLIAYCLAMASHGANGQGCFASDPTLAEEIGLNEAKRVAPYRHEAIRLGWFALTGEEKGRVKVLDIAIPEDDTLARIPADVPAVTKPADTEHDTSTSMAMCDACKPYIAKIYAKEMTMDELRQVHFGWAV